jgi:hypothetical protein
MPESPPSKREGHRYYLRIGKEGKRDVLSFVKSSNNNYMETYIEIA